MGLFDKLFGKTPPTDAVKTSVEHHADGSQTVWTQFTLKGAPRPVQTDVVTALDDALTKLGRGAQVMHASDPSRLLSFEHGGPPIWSVGFVDVPGPTPYTLMLTYGFSHVLSPEHFREGVRHEYSFAVPQGTPTDPWADAFLRHQCRYILSQGADIKPDDCVPLRGWPITRIPFQPQHHAMMPDSTMVGVLCTPDPVFPRVETPHGTIEVRRLVCIDERELDRVETWSAKGFLEELRAVDPLLLTPLKRTSLVDDPAFRARVEKRFAAEGSDMDSVMFDVAAISREGRLELTLPGTPAGRERLINAMVGRVGFGRKLVAHSAQGSRPIVFALAAAKTGAAEQYFVVSGDLEQGDAAEVLRALRASECVVSIKL